MAKKRPTHDSIIKYLRDNRKESIIFEMALVGIDKYNVNVDELLKHIIIYQDNLIKTQKEALNSLNNPALRLGKV